MSELTAREAPKSTWIWCDLSEKCHSDGVPKEMREVERGKPLERETQIW